MQVNMSFKEIKCFTYFFKQFQSDMKKSSLKEFAKTLSLNQEMTGEIRKY